MLEELHGCQQPDQVRLSVDAGFREHGLELKADGVHADTIAQCDLFGNVTLAQGQCDARLCGRQSVDLLQQNLWIAMRGIGRVQHEQGQRS